MAGVTPGSRSCAAAPTQPCQHRASPAAHAAAHTTSSTGTWKSLQPHGACCCSALPASNQQQHPVCKARLKPAQVSRWEIKTPQPACARFSISRMKTWKERRGTGIQNSCRCVFSNYRGKRDLQCSRQSLYLTPSSRVRQPCSAASGWAGGQQSTRALGMASEWEQS